MTRRRRRAPLALATAMLVAACGGEASPSAGTAATETPREGTTTVEPRPSRPDDVHGDDGSIDPALRAFVDRAVADLAERLDTDVARIGIVSAEAVTWSDPSVGCPQPGMRYQQVPVDGTLIRLEVDGVRYRYHSGGNRGEPFLCEQPANDALLDS